VDPHLVPSLFLDQSVPHPSSIAPHRSCSSPRGQKENNSIVIAEEKQRKGRRGREKRKKKERRKKKEEKKKERRNFRDKFAVHTC